MKCTINRKYLPLKLCYFNFVAAFTVLFPYLPIFYKSVGLSHTQCAIIYGTMPFIGFISRIMMGAVADKYRKHKLVLIVCVTMQIIAIDMMVFIPLAGFRMETSEMIVPCSIEECANSLRRDCSLFCENEMNISCKTVNSSSFLSCDNNATCVFSCESEVPQLGNLSIFCIIFALSLVGNVFSNAIISLQDTITYAVLGEKSHAYGKQRLWGAVGCGVFALVCAPLLQLTSSYRGIKFLPAFALHFILSLCTIVSTIPYRVEIEVRGSNIIGNMCRVVSQVKVAVFLMLMFVFGMNFGAIEAFLFWYLEEKLGAWKIQFGFTLLLLCLVEIPTWFVASRIVKKIGHENVFFIVLIANVVRLTGYSLIQNPWMALIFDSLHCITFGLMFSTSIHYGTILAPPGMQATMQSLVMGVCLGIGRGGGGLIAGVIYDAAGPVIMFRSIALFTLFIGILFAFYRCWSMKCRKPPTIVDDANEDVAEKLNVENEDNEDNEEETVRPAEKEEEEEIRL